jgi:class 3 adenylate cyclase
MIRAPAAPVVSEEGARGRIRAFTIALAVLVLVPYSFVVLYFAPHLSVGLAMGATILVSGVAAALFRKGHIRVAMWLVAANTLWLITSESWLFGVQCGSFFLFFVQLSGSFMVSRSREAGRRIASWVWCAAATVYFFGFTPEPLHKIPPPEMQVLFWVNAILAAIGLVAIGAFGSRVLETLSRELAEERAKSEKLLRNMLPAQIAERLKQEPRAIADAFDSVSVLFADLAGFTPMSASMSAREVVDLLNDVFSKFDELARRHGVEKIKTIGDAYMVVGGVPEARGDHAAAVARMALDMLSAAKQLGANGLSLRIGVHAGPAVAGVIGTTKYSYDLWGDTVNTASRMESHGEVGRIHVSDAFRTAAGDAFHFEDRGMVDVKGKGPMRTWWLGAPVR